MKTKWLLLASTCAVAFISFNWLSNSNHVDFNSQIKPLLNKQCLACHGGVKQAGGVSLLFQEEAYGKGKSGKICIVPGHPEQSEMIKRLSTKDEDDRMPYHKSPLKAEEIELLTRWVKQGAEWGQHWAYQPPKYATLPTPSVWEDLQNFFSQRWEKNEIDYFVKQKLDSEHLTSSPEADRVTLIRRVCFDVTGLPPTAAMIEKYKLAPNWDLAYQQLVNELLASPAYGERWAAMWLDLARYSDSRGYQKDNERTIWRYRDWVVQAFNADKPFDQFTKEQLAGDLLPQPTDNQLVATAFHRNTMNNDETGTVDEEFRVAALIDRVNTTWEVWQGTSFGCVQCHTHPYDPFRHEEYYKFMAFFNNTRDEDTIDEAPFLRDFNATDQTKLRELTTYLKTQKPQNFDFLHFAKHLEPRHHAHYADRYVNGALLGDRNIGLKNNGSCRLPNIELTNKTQLLVQVAIEKTGGKLDIRLDSATGPIVGTVKMDSTGKANGRVLQYWPIRPTTGRHDVFLTAQNPKILPNDYFFQISWFVFLPDFPKNDETQKQLFTDLVAAKTNNTPILLATATDYPRKTHVFVRGNWLVNGAEVKPDFPKLLNHRPLLNNKTAKTRLDLAAWLTNRQNPLTARVMVNRFWEQFFGYGLVETLEDFGTAGAKPVNPELLDYLAVRFSGDWQWRMKELVRHVVLSATYRQSSVVSRQLLEIDPQNRLLARGPRLRLPAEMVRDQALAVSGLLSRKMYGKPVLPYQPDGVWQAVNSNLLYKQSEGEDQYRRAIYVFARRTGPYPSMQTFDAGSRELCLSRRIRTNTPLQALVLMNDPVFVEASWKLATRATAKTPKMAIEKAYQLATGRAIAAQKMGLLLGLYAKSLQRFRNKPAQVEAFIKKKSTAEIAALTVVTNAILNLDEVVTKE